MDIEDNLVDRRPDDPDIDDDDNGEVEPSEPGGGRDRPVPVDPPEGGGEPYTDP